MRAMILEKAQKALRLEDVPKPRPGKGQLLIQIECCGLCRTDLHLVDGELSDPKRPLIPGHQIVGWVEKKGPGTKRFKTGQRVGVPWLAWACGECAYCRSGRENLCERARYTGYQVDGGMAEYTLAYEDFCFEIPPGEEGPHLAPFLCAGLIGYRAFKLAGPSQNFGFYGFGSAAHILTQIVDAQGGRVFAFTKPGDVQSQEFAMRLGAFWAGGTDQKSPVELDAALIFAPAGELIPLALSHIKRGGRVVCAGIHMSPIPSFSYDLLWGERSLLSVANLTRADGEEFFEILKKVEIHTEIKLYPLEEVNQALEDLRRGRFQGSAVLKIGDASSRSKG